MKRTGYRIIVLAFLALTSIQIAAGQSPAWEPQRTWVFMVGMLEWKDSESFESFPKENRRDVVLLDVLKKRGVPPDQIVYLQDKVATTIRINTEFVRLLGRTHQGDTIFVYYEGHGYKDEAGKTYFASYDVNDDTNPGWGVAAVPEAIEKYFKGSKAIIALDNCYSGTMVNVVRTGKHRVAYAVMASSSASQSSTGNWTFTEAIISAFRGAPYADKDHDGYVTFAELEANAEADMLFGEEQVASFAFTGGFDPNTRIADADASPSPRVGERVEVYSDNDWFKGYITDARNGKYHIHYYGYEMSDEEWVAANMIRVPHFTSAYKIGERVEVEWKKKWYPAHILNIKGGSHYISYDNYDTDENEWVATNRIRKIK